MATISTISNEIHICTDQLQAGILKAEADVMWATVAHRPWLLYHFYKEFNRRAMTIFGGAGGISPYDGGYTPTGDPTA